MTARVKRLPRITKREKKKLAPQATNAGLEHDHEHEHIHCTACGKHLYVEQFDAPATAAWLKCQHSSEFATCTACRETTQRLLDEHDRTGQPVKFAPSFH